MSVNPELVNIDQVVVIDDDPDFLQGTQRILKDICRVPEERIRGFQSALEAIAFLNEWCIKYPHAVLLIITDFSMKVKGDVIARSVIAKRDQKLTNVIYISSHHRDEIRNQLTPGSGYVNKAELPQGLPKYMSDHFRIKA